MKPSMNGAAITILLEPLLSPDDTTVGTRMPLALVLTPLLHRFNEALLLDIIDSVDILMLGLSPGPIMILTFLSSRLCRPPWLL